MNVLADLIWALLMLAAAVKLLTLNLWRAVLFIAPGSLQLRPEVSPTSPELPGPLAPVAELLRARGFVALGTHLEKPLLHAATRCHDFVHPGERAFATLYASEAQRPLLYLLTPLTPEGLVFTPAFKPSGFALPGRYRSRALEGATLERLLKSHRERCEGLALAEDFTPEARLQVGRAWYQGPGRPEIRRQNLQGLLWTLVALAIVALLFGSHGE